ncbi:3-hydroxyacyl-CoA dehydrogenase type-2-like isoform X2 [Cydia pomonella]|uniref:3-hydroxyacyl-CoA dehydrogenase type-2-like isoform X2 n=1 Tax=Cydia pomonella TaxID=82600 RepID=UPI002ADDEB4D|nr:3-hydroxyacyl-CoA dehydrogenase type-2-like isoform X2 [Cydia pomonella]
MLKGMVSLVTGGASGLGKATVERFINHGGRVVILDLQATRAEQVAKQFGSEAIACPGCITSEDDVKKALQLAKDKFGRLDTLVNCAGHVATHQIYNFNKDRPCELEGFQKCVNINTIGTFNVTRLAVGLMGQNKPNEQGQRGVVVNTASTIAYEGDIGRHRRFHSCHRGHDVTHSQGSGAQRDQGGHYRCWYFRHSPSLILTRENGRVPQTYDSIPLKIRQAGRVRTPSIEYR